VLDKTVSFYISAVFWNRNVELSMVSNKFLDTSVCTLQPYQYRESGEILYSYLRKKQKRLEQREKYQNFEGFSGKVFGSE